MTRPAFAERAGATVRSIQVRRRGVPRRLGAYAHGAVRVATVELGWWPRVVLGAAWFITRRTPALLFVLAGLVWLLAPLGRSLPAGWLAMAAAEAVVLRGWARLWPGSFWKWCAAPALGLGWACWLRWRWRQVTEACGLTAVRHPGSELPTTTRRPAHRRDVGHPRIESVRIRWPRVSTVVRPVLGQTVSDFEKAGEALRTGLGATQLRVQPHQVNRVGLTFTVGDPLAAPFAALVDDQDHHDHDGAVAGLVSVRLGRVEDGSVWRLPVGPHTLVAGCSGAGKGSVFWGFAFGLAPAAAAGRVRLHGIDLKGGMELLMGAGLFTTTATTPAAAVTLLERLVELMRDRTHRYAGVVRSHAPSVEEPLHVVMIDELAALTAYCPERDLQRRGELAVNLLCSQGRAPGFMVFACLQDPRKEVIPARGLFTQMVGLRLKDAAETAMVLGDQAVTTGAHCHRIPRHTPGVGYVLPEHGGPPVRVRAGYASDPMIRQMAARFPAPATMEDSGAVVVGMPPAELCAPPGRGRAGRPCRDDNPAVAGRSRR